MKITKFLRNFLLGAGFALALEYTGVYDNLGDKIINQYDNFKSSLQSKSGIAYLSISDRDGLDAVTLENNTLGNQKLTQIPTIELHNFYTNRFIVTLPDLKQGEYDFKATITDDKGNIEEKLFEINIQNPNGGLDTLYGSPAMIDNLRLPGGKENFKL